MLNILLETGGNAISLTSDTYISFGTILILLGVLKWFYSEYKAIKSNIEEREKLVYAKIDAISKSVNDKIAGYDTITKENSEAIRDLHNAADKQEKNDQHILDIFKSIQQITIQMQQIQINMEQKGEIIKDLKEEMKEQREINEKLQKSIHNLDMTMYGIKNTMDILSSMLKK